MKLRDLSSESVPACLCDCVERNKQWVAVHDGRSQRRQQNEGTELVMSCEQDSQCKRNCFIHVFKGRWFSLPPSLSTQPPCSGNQCWINGCLGELSEESNFSTFLKKRWRAKNSNRRCCSVQGGHFIDRRGCTVQGKASRLVRHKEIQWNELSQLCWCWQEMQRIHEKVKCAEKFMNLYEIWF